MLTLLRGYSGSGKSTIARDIAAASSDTIIVSRDTIRAQMTGSVIKQALSHEREEQVTKIEHAQVETALKAGLHVIVDNTNLKASFARQYLNIAADLGVSWNVIDFKTPLDECLARNAARPEIERVPESVIRTQAKRFPIEKWPVLTPGQSHFKVDWPPYVPPKNGGPAWAFDIDGTLAHHENVRGVYDTSKYHLDEVDEGLSQLFWTLVDVGERVVVFSGRDSAYRDVTERWLHKHSLYPDALYMRPEGDRRRDDVVKAELLDACPYRIQGVFDDRLRVCRMWHARGVPVFKVGDPDGGDF